MSHVINSTALTGEKPCINKAIHALLTCTATQLSIWSYRGHRSAAVTRCVLPGPRTSIVRGNCVRETKQNSVRNNAKCSKCFKSLCNNSDRTWINIRQVPWEVLKTAAHMFNLSFCCPYISLPASYCPVNSVEVLSSRSINPHTFAG